MPAASPLLPDARAKLHRVTCRAGLGGRAGVLFVAAIGMPAAFHTDAQCIRAFSRHRCIAFTLCSANPMVSWVQHVIDYNWLWWG
jgi:hypothetical protein